MKRSLIAVSLAVAASVAFAATEQYRLISGEQDVNSLQLGEAGIYKFESNETDHGIQLGDAGQYRFDAGEQDVSTPIADAYRFDAGQKDEHEPKVG